MEKIKEIYSYYKKEIFIIISLLSIILLTCISFFIIDKKYKADKIDEKDMISTSTESNIQDKETEKIKVDVKGFVQNPGVYELDANSRVIDAIEKAGGLLENAHTKYINLSKLLIDENVIIINSDEEIEEVKQEKEDEIICEITNDTCVRKDEIISSEITIKEYKETSNESTKENELNTLVNINTASKEILMSLSGIGESKALSIIEYRTTNGNFKNIEELKNVKGIGESIYAKIKDNITV